MSGSATYVLVCDADGCGERFFARELPMRLRDVRQLAAGAGWTSAFQRQRPGGGFGWTSDFCPGHRGSEPASVSPLAVTRPLKPVKR